ncbi:MAG TPA: DUF6101 family protein [Bauldia sp.]|nr:DUF6101 family protein [Bauldia sp.]
MRQAVKTGGAAAGSSRFFRLDPFALPVRHGERDEAFILDRDRAVVRRSLSGVAATLDVPVSAYRGVAVRMFTEGEEGDLRVVVELMHPDAALSLPLAVAGEPEDVAADWVAWGRALNLPLLFVEQDGTVSSPDAGGPPAPKPGRRRGGAPFRGRRSRFARRRKIGEHKATERLDGREIIARD